MSKPKEIAKIEECSSRPFQDGFFRGVEALELGKYNCKESLTLMKEAGYTIRSAEGQKFVQGWKFSTQ